MAKIDWGFTEDGDIELGEPRMDGQGLVLYKHLDGIVDTDKREDGKEIRDIGTVYDLDAEKQVIINRLRTDSPEWYHHPGMGGNLTDLIGEPNTKETGAIGARYIYKALTYGGLYNGIQLNIRPVPLSIEEIVFMIDIVRFDNEVVRLPLTFNLQTGLMDFYQTPKPSEEGV